MQTHKFSIKEALKFSWNTVINHIGFFVVMLLASFIVMLVPQSMASSDSGIVAGIGSVIAATLGMLIGLGYIKVSLKLLDGGEPAFSDFIPTSRHFISFLIASVICAVVVGLGFILLVLPGVVLAILFSVTLRFYPFYILEKNMGAVESLKASWAATKGSRMQIFKLLILSVLIVMAGALLLGVGLFLAIPLALMSQAYVYRKLSSTPTLATEVA